MIFVRKTILPYLLILTLLPALGACGGAEPPAAPAVSIPEPPEPEPLPEPEPASEPLAEEPAIVTAMPADNATSASYSWSFIRNSEHLPPGIPAVAADMLARYPALYLGPAEQNQIYLTFDCGYELGYAPAILDTLAAHEAPALFFLTGHYIASQPDLVLRMQAEGHRLGNHTYNHPDPTAITREELATELESLNAACIELTGEPLAPYMRPPAGKFSAQSLRWTGELGYTSVFWSMAFHDWDPADQPGAEWVYDHVTANIHPGAVILLHIVSESDTQALDRILTELKAQGYAFAVLE